MGIRAETCTEMSVSTGIELSFPLLWSRTLGYNRSVPSPEQTYPSTTSPPSDLPHIPELDGIRGLAALAVFCHHVLFTSIARPSAANAILLFLYNVSRLGAFGVDLFFVLSGFLITSLILLDRHKPNFYWNFYWKRALRIFPLYIVSLVCLALLVRSSRPYVVFSALFIANFAPAFHVVADGPFWTLAIEEQFYLVWPQLGRRLTVSRLQQLALAVVVACFVLRLGAASLGHHAFRYTFYHCDGLALGAYLACKRSRQANEVLQQQTGARLKRILFATSALTFSLLPSLLDLSGRLLMFAEAVQVLAVSTVSYGIVGTAVRYSGSRTLRIFRSNLLTFFGLVSYCLYVSHLYILRGYDYLFGTPQADAPQDLLLRFSVILMTTVAVCMLSRYLIELPAIRLRRFVLRKS